MQPLYLMVVLFVYYSQINVLLFFEDSKEKSQDAMIVNDIQNRAQLIKDNLWIF